MNFGSLNLYHALGRAGPDLLHPRHYFAGKIIERFGERRIFSLQHCWLPGIPGFAEFRIERNISQEWYAELLRGLLRSTAGKNINFMLAVGADEIAHVLHHAHQIYLHLAKHFDGLARILQRNVRWRGNHHRPVNGTV